MIHYKPVNVTIDASGLVKVIIDMVVRYYGVEILKLIVMDQRLLFTLKFWSLLYYFLEIQKKTIYNLPPSNK